MSYLFPRTELAEFVAALLAADLRATIDPSRVNTPGIWVRLTTLDHDRLGCSSMRVDCVCIARDTVDAAALDDLADLHDALLAVPVVDVAGPIRFQGTILPGPDLTALPSLVVPVHVT